MLSDIGDSTSAAAAAHSAALEATRLHGLLEGGAGASQKMLEAAQADQAKTRAEAEIAAARLSLHWGPLVEPMTPGASKDHRRGRERARRIAAGRSAGPP